MSQWQRRSHAELARLHDNKNWNELWRHARPLVKLTIRKLMRRGRLDPFYVREDLYQEAQLAAWEAIPKWFPLEAKFSTWVVVNVRRAVLDHQRREAGGMVGGRDARGQTVSLYAASVDAESDDDESLERGLLGSLSYQDPPEGFDPERETEHRQHARVVQRALSALSRSERHLICALFGIGREQQLLTEYVRATGTPYYVAHRRHKKIIRKLRKYFPKVAILAMTPTSGAPRGPTHAGTDRRTRRLASPLAHDPPDPHRRRARRRAAGAV